MDRVLCSLLLIGTTLGFAINSDDFGRGFGQRRDPTDKTALGRVRIERGKNIAKGVMGWRSVGEGTEAPQ